MIFLGSRHWGLTLGKAGKDLSSTELANAAKAAIKQMHEKKYTTDMEYHGIKKIDLFGIAFSGNKCITYIPNSL